MSQLVGVTIAQDSANINEYLIRDKDKINIGRFNIIDLNGSIKTCTIKFKFYREDDYYLLKDTLIKVLNAVFKDISINKVNIITNDTISLAAFLDCGFILEGIFTENLYSNGRYKDEISMGITRADYNLGEKITLVELQGQNITLKILTPEYSQDLLDYYIRNRNHLEAFEPKRDNEFYTIDVQKKILTESYRHFMTGISIDFGIFKDDKFIGKIRLSNIVNGIFKSGIIGYSIDKNYQGKGYMKEAVNLVVDYAFKDLDLHRVEASALLDNNRSKGVLEGCGFKLLGINEKYLFINGAWRDHVTYYKIKEKSLR